MRDENEAPKLPPLRGGLPSAGGALLTKIRADSSIMSAGRLAKHSLARSDGISLSNSRFSNVMRSTVGVRAYLKGASPVIASSYRPNRHGLPATVG